MSSPLLPPEHGPRLVRTLLVYGMLAGLAAGLLAFLVALVLGEPQVQHAVAFEEHLLALRHQAPEPELVSRGTQRTLGLLSGTLAVGVALGGIFALVFAYAHGRIGAFGPRTSAAVLGGLAFVLLTLVPFTKYPANPPSIGNPDTLGRRTLVYFAMVAISLLSAVAARRAAKSTSGPNSLLLAGAVFIALIAAAELILPAIHETPAGFPADVLYRFRLASLAIHATMWLSIALIFGALADRAIAHAPTPSRRWRPRRSPTPA